LVSERPVFWALRRVRSGQAEIIILRGFGSGEPRQRIAVVPGHPLRRTLLKFRSVPQQFGEIVERIGAVELARMNQAHEQITDSGAVQCLIEECVLAVQDGFLQGALDDIVIDWRPCVAQEKRQLRPVIE